MHPENHHMSYSTKAKEKTMKQGGIESRKQWLQHRQGVKESWGQCGEKSWDGSCTTEESSQSRPKQEERGFGREHPNEKEKSDSFHDVLMILLERPKLT